MEKNHGSRSTNVISTAQHTLNPVEHGLAWLTLKAENLRGRHPKDIDKCRHAIRHCPGIQVWCATSGYALGTARQRSFSPAVLNDEWSSWVFLVFHRTSAQLSSCNSPPQVVTPNDVTFCNPAGTTFWEAIDDDDSELDWIGVDAKMLEPSPVVICRFNEARRDQFFACAAIGSKNLLVKHKIFTTVNHANSATKNISASCVIELVGKIILDAVDYWKAMPRSFQKRPTCSARRRRTVNEAKAILAREYRSEVSLVEIADRLHCSAAHLSRAFHADTGLKITAYRQELRLRSGLSLLQNSALGVGDIAFHVGFASHSHFSSAFKRSFGIIPSELTKWKS